MTSEQEQARFDRLPPWAKQRIHQLEDNVSRQQARIEEISSPHPDTNVLVNGWDIYPDFTLPPDSQIEFVMGTDSADENKWRDKISVGHVRSNKGRDILRIQGDKSLIIRCSASNSFEVTFDDR